MNNSQKICEIFAKYFRNISEIFAKYSRNICEKFVKNLRKIKFRQFFMNFSRILIFRKYFANISWIFCKYFSNISQIFCKYFSNILRIFCVRPREESVRYIFSFIFFSIFWKLNLLENYDFVLFNLQLGLVSVKSRYLIPIKAKRQSGVWQTYSIWNLFYP